MPTLHICLVSRQTLPNLLPFLLPDRPEEAILLVTPEMRAGAATLEGLLRERCVKATRREVTAASHEAVREAVLNILAERDDARIVLNLTGGTKLMALGALDALGVGDYAALYVDTEAQSLVRFRPEYAVTPLPAVLDVKTCLRAHGLRIKADSAAPTPAPRRDLTSALVARAGRLGRALGALNGLARQAAEVSACLTVHVDDRLLREPRFLEAVTLFNDAGLLRLTGASLSFASEADRAYVNGGWLEEHVFSALYPLRAGGTLTDLRRNVEVTTDDGVDNELDLALTASNRLYVIECKTKRADVDTARMDDAIYRLETLRQGMGGALGRAVLVSYRPLREADRRRCHKADIALIESHDLPNAPRLLQRLIAG